ncbi:MAG: VOC family protein [Boseongicola sp.]
MNFSHVNIVARDTDKLADFYKEVFGCEDRSLRESISGEKPSLAMGLPNTEFYAAWLNLPGVDGPYLEIFQFKEFEECTPPSANRIGLAHLAFDVEDLSAVCDAVVAAGGSAFGEVASFEEAGKILFSFVFMRDPEGNLLDLKQRF